MTAAFSFSPHTFLAAVSDAGSRAAVPHGERDTDVRDRTLIIQVARGEVEGLSALMSLYAGRLAQFAEAFVDGRDAADDVVQEVFVWLWERRDTLDVHGSVASYLYKATRNRALNASRSQRSHERLAGHIAAEPPPAPRNEGADRLDADALRIEVHDILQIVPARCREIFLLVWGRDLSYAEVADILSVNVRTVQTQ